MGDLVAPAGGGFSGIAVHEGRLYTMYRAAGDEFIVCLDAATGRTNWQHQYAAPKVPQDIAVYGTGPSATPLIADGFVFAIGWAGGLRCLDAATGDARWSHDLWEEFDGTRLEFGCCASPIGYENTIITLVGGKGQSIVAFDKQSGGVAWKSLSFASSFSTPRILKIGGRDQLVTFMDSEAIGADPRTGALKWRYEIANHWKQNIVQPVLAGDDLLVVSTVEAGSRGLKLLDGGGGVEELWSSRKLQFFYGSVVQIGDCIYGSSGFEKGFMSAVDPRTGKVLWRKRGFGLANVVGIGERLIILDEEGWLALATPSRTDLTVHSKAKVLQMPARTAPSIAGGVLYARDWHKIIALDLR